MTIEESASYLKTSSDTVEKLIRDGELPACKVGKMYVLTKENLYAFLIQRTQLQSAERRNILHRDDQLMAAIKSEEPAKLPAKPTSSGRGRKRNPSPLADQTDFVRQWMQKKN